MATDPIEIHHNDQGYFLSTRNPHVDKNGTANINATDQSARICFNPTTTPFGAYQDVQKDQSPIQIPVGDNDYSVGYCLNDYGQSCSAPPPTSPVLTTTGTIKVGSGGNTPGPKKVVTRKTAKPKKAAKKSAKTSKGSKAKKSVKGKKAAKKATKKATKKVAKKSKKSAKKRK